MINVQGKQEIIFQKQWDYNLFFQIFKNLYLERKRPSKYIHTMIVSVG